VYAVQYGLLGEQGVTVTPVTGAPGVVGVNVTTVTGAPVGVEHTAPGGQVVGQQGCAAEQDGVVVRDELPMYPFPVPPPLGGGVPQPPLYVHAFALADTKARNDAARITTTTSETGDRNCDKHLLMLVHA